MFSERFFPIATKFAWSSIDLMTIWMIMILLTGDAILWNGYMKKLTVEEIQTTGWGHFCYLYHVHLLTQLGLWSFAISTFVRKPNLRKCNSRIQIHFSNTYFNLDCFSSLFFRSFRNDWFEIKLYLVTTQSHLDLLLHVLMGEQCKPLLLKL